MSYLSLKAVSDYGDFTVNTILRESLLYYFNWGFLEVGAFNNVALSTSGAVGYDNSKLYNVTGPTNYTAGKYWESNRKNWVWESGLSYSVNSINISGVYINGSFHPSTGVGVYAHSIDYINGRVVFDTAISTSSTVQAEYSYKRIKFTDIDNPLFKKVQEASLLNDNVNVTLGSGNNQQLGQNRLQTPIVAIEPVPRRSYPDGIQLGGGTYLHQDVLFHIYTDTSFERDKIFDIICNQKGNTIVLVDINKLADNNAYPININGNIVNNNTRNYNNLVGTSSIYGWRQCILHEVYGQEQTVINNKLHAAIVRMTVKIPMADI